MDIYVRLEIRGIPYKEGYVVFVNSNGDHLVCGYAVGLGYNEVYNDKYKLVVCEGVGSYIVRENLDGNVYSMVR